MTQLDVSNRTPCPNLLGGYWGVLGGRVQKHILKLTHISERYARNSASRVEKVIVRISEMKNRTVKRLSMHFRASPDF